VSESTMAWRSAAETVVFGEQAARMVARMAKRSRDMPREVRVAGVDRAAFLMSGKYPYTRGGGAILSSRTDGHVSPV